MFIIIINICSACKDNENENLSQFRFGYVECSVSSIIMLFFGWAFYRADFFLGCHSKRFQTLYFAHYVAAAFLELVICVIKSVLV